MATNPGILKAAGRELRFLSKPFRWAAAPFGWGAKGLNYAFQRAPLTVGLPILGGAGLLAGLGIAANRAANRAVPEEMDAIGAQLAENEQVGSALMMHRQAAQMPYAQPGAVAMMGVPTPEGGIAYVPVGQEAAMQNAALYAQANAAMPQPQLQSGAEYQGLVMQPNMQQQHAMV